MVGPKPSKSLHGKSIYLDLFGYRNVAEFEKNLQLLGAVVEKCFSKDVSHVITNRASVINSQTRSASKNATTEAAVASPLSLSPFAESGASQSPFAISPTMTESVSRPMTRGQAIVQKAMLSRKRGSTNVVECAQQWNIKVIHIDAAVKWMKKELGALEAQKQEKKKSKGNLASDWLIKLSSWPPHSRTAIMNWRSFSVSGPRTWNGLPGALRLAPRAMQLKRPYIKFEESRSRFGPEFKILAGFPSLEFNGPRRTCPFDQFAQPCSVENAGNEAESSPFHKALAADDGMASEAEHRQVKADAKLSAKVKQKKPDKEKQKLTNVPVSSSVDEKLMTAGELQKLKNNRIEATKQRGFCEICDTKYDSMLQHLTTEKHKSFVEDVGNYMALDELISQFHDQTASQLIDPVRTFSKVIMQSSTVSSEADECDLNLLALPSSSLSSNFKRKVPPAWNNSCSTFFCGRGSNGEVQVANNTFQQSATNLPPKPTADEREPKEPGIKNCSVENTCNGNSWEKHPGFNEQKSCEDVTNCASVDRITVNGMNVVGSLVDFGDYRCENLITRKASNTLQADDNSRGNVESEASCKTNAASMSPLNICFVQQLDNLELDSEDVSSEIPVIPSRHHCRENCQLDSEAIHVSAEPPLAQTFATDGCTMSCEVALSAFPELQPSNHTDQLRVQSQISCHTGVTGSPCECHEHYHSGVMHSPSKCRKRCHSYMMDSPLKCPKLPLPEVIHLDSLDCPEKRFLSQKRRRIKFYRAVSVLTNRSVLELFESDTSSDFEGFTHEYEPVVSDLSYDEVSEALLSIDSDFEWESPSCDSRSNARSTDADTGRSIFSENPMTSTAPIIASVDSDCILKMAFDSASPVTQSNSNQNIRTIDDLSTLESDRELYLPNDTSSNLSGVFNCYRKDTPPSFADTYSSLCASEQVDILDYIDKDESNVLVKPVPLTENCSSRSARNDESGSNQLSVDDKSSSSIAVNVKLSHVPVNVKLPLSMANVKDNKSRSWQPVVALWKCDDWVRGYAGHKEEQMYDSCSAVQDELLKSKASDVYSHVEASKLRRKLNFSRVNSKGQSSELKEKKSLRMKTKCSRIMKSLPPENLSVSSDSFCAVEMPKALNVLDLVDLESKEEENVEEVVATDIPNNGYKLCSESSTDNFWDRNSIDSYFSDTTAKHKTRSIFTQGQRSQKISNCTVSCESFTALKSNKTPGAGEIPMRTDDFTQTAADVRNAVVTCNQRARELVRTDQDFNEMGASSDVIAVMQLKSCYDDIQHHKMWQPVVTLDRFSVETNISCHHHRTVSVSSRSDTGRVARVPSMQNGMVSIRPLSSFDSVFLLGDALGSEMSFANNEEVLFDEGKISRRLVVSLNRCDSQLANLSVDVSTQKTAPSNKAALVEKQNLLAVESHDECPVDTTSLNNHEKDVNVAVDLKSCQLHEPEDKAIGMPTLCVARICRSKTFRNSNHKFGSIDVNAKKKLTIADVNLRNTIGTDAVIVSSEEPLQAMRRISLPNSVMQNSVVEITSSGNSSNGPISNTNSKSSKIVGGHHVRRSIYSQLNRSLSRKYLDWSKPETYVASNDAKFPYSSNTNPSERQDSSKKVKVRRYQWRSRSFNHLLPRSKADWSKRLSPE